MHARSLHPLSTARQITLFASPPHVHLRVFFSFLLFVPSTPRFGSARRLTFCVVVFGRPLGRVGPHSALSEPHHTRRLEPINGRHLDQRSQRSLVSLCCAETPTPLSATDQSVCSAALLTASFCSRQGRPPSHPSRRLTCNALSVFFCPVFSSLVLVASVLPL